jgi:hypothetical protein
VLDSVKDVLTVSECEHVVVVDGVCVRVMVWVYDVPDAVMLGEWNDDRVNDTVFDDDPDMQNEEDVDEVLLLEIEKVWVRLGEGVNDGEVLRVGVSERDVVGWTDVLDV